MENELYISSCFGIFINLKYLHHFVFQSSYPTFNTYSILIPRTKDYNMFSNKSNIFHITWIQCHSLLPHRAQQLDHIDTLHALGYYSRQWYKKCTAAQYSSECLPLHYIQLQWTQFYFLIIPTLPPNMYILAQITLGLQCMDIPILNYVLSYSIN